MSNVRRSKAKAKRIKQLAATGLDKATICASADINDKQLDKLYGEEYNAGCVEYKVKFQEAYNERMFKGNDKLFVQSAAKFAKQEELVDTSMVEIKKIELIIIPPELSLKDMGQWQAYLEHKEEVEE